MEIELMQDGTSVTKTSRTSQAGGAIVGAALLGGVGAIIGGLSGSSETRDKIDRLDLRVMVNDLSKPIHNISFILATVKKGTQQYKDSIAAAEHWYGVLQVLIKQTEQESQAIKEIAATKIDSRCPKCDAEIKASWKSCPFCATTLNLSTCHICNAEIMPGWKCCPNCSTQLSD